MDKETVAPAYDERVPGNENEQLTATRSVDKPHKWFYYKSRQMHPLLEIRGMAALGRESDYEGCKGASRELITVYENSLSWASYALGTFRHASYILQYLKNLREGESFKEGKDRDKDRNTLGQMETEKDGQGIELTDILPSPKACDVWPSLGY